MSDRLAKQVSERLRGATFGLDEVPVSREAMFALSELVEAGAALNYRAGDADMDEQVEAWDEALRRVANSLRVTR